MGRTQSKLPTNYSRSNQYDKTVKVFKIVTGHLLHMRQQLSVVKNMICYIIQLTALEADGFNCLNIFPACKAMFSIHAKLISISSEFWSHIASQI